VASTQKSDDLVKFKEGIGVNPLRGTPTVPVANTVLGVNPPGQFWRIGESRDLDGTKAQLNAAISDIWALAIPAAERFYQAGMICAFIKKVVGHGNFTASIEQNVACHPRTIRRYIRYFEACNAGCSEGIACGIGQEMACFWA
jgi:hypothetical protein